MVPIRNGEINRQVISRAGCRNINGHILFFFLARFIGSIHQVVLLYEIEPFDHFFDIADGYPVFIVVR
jgi:hypothetical protein